MQFSFLLAYGLEVMHLGSLLNKDVPVEFVLLLTRLKCSPVVSELFVDHFAIDPLVLYSRLSVVELQVVVDIVAVDTVVAVTVAVDSCCHTVVDIRLLIVVVDHILTSMVFLFLD